jgi:hypothetical protein
MKKYFAVWEVNWTSLMLQTWSRNSICIYARHEPLMTNPWYFSDDDDHVSWIYTCTLACYLILVGAWMSPNLWDCKPLTFWAISTSPSSYYMVVEYKEAWNHSTYPLTISIYQNSFGIKFHDYHFGYTSAFPCKTNPCRKMNSNYKWCSQLLMDYINLEHPTQVRLYDQDQHHNLRYVIPS